MKGNSITVSHGGGGRVARELVNRIIIRHFGGKEGMELPDAADLRGFKGGKARFTSDSFVIQPLFFPGGDIGKLSVCGTVNDLVVSGAEPVALSFSLIIEEGFPISKLDKICLSAARTAKRANVPIVCGDTKVVSRGQADGLFINTSGVGRPLCPVMKASAIRPEDVIIITGSVGQHGMAILSVRKGLDFVSSLKSDCAPLSDLVLPLLLDHLPIRWMRDPTRGGLAGILNELSIDSNLGIEMDETMVPVSRAARSIGELTGLDPLDSACEGRAVIVVPPRIADPVLNRLKKHPSGRKAAIIGTMTASHPGLVALRTSSGARRILDWPSGEQLPRIC